MSGNPWRRGIFIGTLSLAVLGGLFVTGTLVALAVGAQFASSQDPDARWYARGLLAIMIGMVFVFTMSGRWDRRHEPEAKS